MHTLYPHTRARMHTHLYPHTHAHMHTHAGAPSTSWINAKNVIPNFLIYKRISPIALPRRLQCPHKIKVLLQMPKLAYRRSDIRQS